MGNTFSIISSVITFYLYILQRKFVFWDEIYRFSFLCWSNINKFCQQTKSFYSHSLFSYFNNQSIFLLNKIFLSTYFSHMEFYLYIFKDNLIDKSTPFKNRHSRGTIKKKDLFTTIYYKIINYLLWPYQRSSLYCLVFIYFCQVQAISIYYILTQQSRRRKDNVIVVISRRF